jgi:ABC-2 type transport system ATP-binding protein
VLFKIKAQEGAPMIELKNLTKRFGENAVVDHLTFTVTSGEILGFLGPNGAGKSTTMKMITGFLLPSEGSVSVCGHDIVDDTLAAQACMGYLPEGAPSYGDMTVSAFLGFIADIRGLKGIHKTRAIESVIERIELGGVIKQSIETLSKGFRRRVGVAQAILHDPKVLIMDEPTDGLDPNQKQQVRDLIRNLSRDKIVVVSTHILEEVTAVCTRAIIINQGRLVADATPAQLEAQSPRHQAVTIHFKQHYAFNEALNTIEGVDHIESSEHDYKVTVFPRDERLLFTDVMNVVQRQGWEIDSIYVEQGHLDDVFRLMTAGKAL